MSLKYTEKTVREVDYSEWDDFINNAYGKPYRSYDIVADQELSNDMCKEVRVSAYELDEWQQEEVQTFLETGRGNFITDTLTTDLANRGLLEEGTYLVQVCW